MMKYKPKYNVIYYKIESILNNMLLGDLENLDLLIILLKDILNNEILMLDQDLKKKKIIFII